MKCPLYYVSLSKVENTGGLYRTDFMSVSLATLRGRGGRGLFLNSLMKSLYHWSRSDVLFHGSLSCSSFTLILLKCYPFFHFFIGNFNPHMKIKIFLFCGNHCNIMKFLSKFQTYLKSY